MISNRRWISRFVMTCFLGVFSTFPQVLFANWHLNTEVDEFDESKSTTMFRWDKKYRSIGLRCDNKENSNTLMITFDAGEVISSPGSDVWLYMKVDDNKSHKYRARTWRNSYEGGYIAVVDDKSKSIIREMIPGSILKSRVDAGSSIVDFTVSLNGFTKNASKLLPLCNYVPDELNAELTRQKNTRIETKANINTTTPNESNQKASSENVLELSLIHISEPTR